MKKRIIAKVIDKKLKICYHDMTINFGLTVLLREKERKKMRKIEHPGYHKAGRILFVLLAVVLIFVPATQGGAAFYKTYVHTPDVVRPKPRTTITLRLPKKKFNKEQIAVMEEIIRGAYDAQAADKIPLLLAISFAESQFNPQAFRPKKDNPRGGNDRGAFQINDKHNGHVPDAVAYKPRLAAKWAAQEIAKGNLWKWKSSRKNWEGYVPLFKGMLSHVPPQS